MLMLVLRIIFVCAGAILGFHIANQLYPADIIRELLGLAYGTVICLSFVGVEWIISKRPIPAIFTVVFGLLVGFVLSNIFFRLVVLALGPDAYQTMGFSSQPAFEGVLGLGLTLIFCYLGVSIIYHTRDNFNFIIPYVEFKKEEKHTRPVLLDTSTIIDGRIVDICETKIIDNPFVVPKFVLDELRLIADSPDRLKRNRGRRGLDMLNRLQRSGIVDIRIQDPLHPITGDVDNKLVKMAKTLDAKIVTNDLNLNKIAQFQGVDVVNVNDLANALKPHVLQGEELKMKIVKPGEEAGQGVGFLDDGTMVVVEEGRSKIGTTVAIVVTNVLQTSAGRLIFGKLKPE